MLQVLPIHLQGLHVPYNNLTCTLSLSYIPSYVYTLVYISVLHILLKNRAWPGSGVAEICTTWISCTDTLDGRIHLVCTRKSPQPHYQAMLVSLNNVRSTHTCIYMYDGMYEVKLQAQQLSPVLRTSLVSRYRDDHYTTEETPLITDYVGKVLENKYDLSFFLKRKYLRQSFPGGLWVLFLTTWAPSVSVKFLQTLWLPSWLLCGTPPVFASLCIEHPLPCFP